MIISNIICSIGNSYLHILNIPLMPPSYPSSLFVWYPSTTCCYFPHPFFYLHDIFRYSYHILVCYQPIIGSHLPKNLIPLIYCIGHPPVNSWIMLDFCTNVIFGQLYRVWVFYIFHHNPICWSVLTLHVHFTNTYVSLKYIKSIPCIIMML